MEQATIKHIEQNAVAQIAAHIVATCDEPITILPQGYTIERLEQYQLNPERFRGVFSTSSLQHFLNFANEQGEVICMVDPENMQAVAYFNLGNPEYPGHGDYRARLTLKKTAPYRELLSLHEKILDQKQFAEWLQDWRDYLMAEDDDHEAIEMKKAIQAVRSISINKHNAASHEEKTFSSAKSSIERIDASSESRLPAALIFRCNPYNEISLHGFQIRISLLTTGETPRFKMHLIQHEVKQEEMAVEFCDLINAGIKVDGAEIYIGEFKK